MIKRYSQLKQAAYINPGIISYVFKALNIDEKSVQKLGEGDNGVAFKKGNTVIKITSDPNEAEFAGTIKGHKLNRVANVSEVYELDTERGEDNRTTTKFSKSRYYWVIIKEYVPTLIGGNYDFATTISYFYNVTDRNFDYSKEAFDKMISNYIKEHSMLFSDEEYDPDEDEELQYSLQILESLKELHMELKPLGILSASDMKGSNAGMDEEGELVFIELHIYRTAEGYVEPTYTPLGA